AVFGGGPRSIGLCAIPASVGDFAIGGKLATFGFSLSSLGLKRSGAASGSSLRVGGGGSLTTSGSTSDRPVGMTLSFAPWPHMSRWAVLGTLARLISSFGNGGAGRMTI